MSTMIKIFSSDMTIITREHWENPLYEVIAEKEFDEDHWVAWVRDRDKNDENDLWTIEIFANENYQRFKEESVAMDT